MTVHQIKTSLVEEQELVQDVLTDSWMTAKEVGAREILVVMVDGTGEAYVVATDRISPTMLGGIETAKIQLAATLWQCGE